MAASTTSHTRRNAAIAAAIVAVLGTAGVAFALNRPTTTSAPAAATGVGALKQVAVTSGALATTESVNGSVVLDDVTDVLHRIEGQNTVTVKAASTAAPSTGNSSRSGTGNATGNAAGLLTQSVNLGPSTPSSSPSDSSGPGTTSPCTTPTSNPGGGHGGSTTTSSSTSTTTSTTDPGSSTSSSTTSSTEPVTSTTQPCSDTSTSTTSPRRGIGGSGSGGTGGSGSTATGGSAGSSTVTQMVTSVISVGSEVKLGTIIYSVESRPVVVMAGVLPAWRTLASGVTDGPDVRQLELSLVALGYDRDSTMTVDDHFDSHTKAAVERWQAGYGLDVTGSVTLGSIVFLPSITTVSAVDVKVGQAISDGTTVISLTGSSQQVVIAVPTGDESFVVPGLTLKVGSGEGTVTSLRSVVQNGTATVEAVITPSAAIEGVTNGSTVKVTIARSQLSDVLLVPSAALASRLDGSYAVQVLGADGSASWVTVEVLGSANGSTAIKGDGITTSTKVLQAP